MITLKDHHGEGTLPPIGRDAPPASHPVSDAIANLDRALADAGHKPGTWALILGDGAVLINEPVVKKAARAIARREAYDGLKMMLATGFVPATSNTGSTRLPPSCYTAPDEAKGILADEDDGA